jgi:hypothetical protein
MRVESTITESNGSSSMASVCGGCLALLDAGEVHRTLLCPLLLLLLLFFFRLCQTSYRGVRHSTALVHNTCLHISA